MSKGLKRKQLETRKRIFAIKKLTLHDFKKLGKTDVNLLNFHALKGFYELVFKSNLNDDFEEHNTNKHIIKDNEKIYFVGNLEVGQVKIGYTTDINKRLKAIQTYCPFDVTVLKLERGSMENEKRYHIDFSPYHIKGEWFKIEGELKVFLMD